MATATARTLTIYRGDLSFIRQVDGEIVQQGNLKHRHTLKTLCAYMKYRGYTVVIKKGKSTTMSKLPDNYSKKQRDQIDLNHYNALRELQAVGFPEKIHPSTRAALIKRGFLDVKLPAPCITPDGLEFLGDHPLPAEPVTPAESSHDQPLPLITYDEAVVGLTEDPTRIALRKTRDSLLALVENVIAEKAPEVKPAIAAIRDANRVLAE